MADQFPDEASDDAVMTRIGQAVMLHRGGDREEARNRLEELWCDFGAQGDALHRCTLAHYLADTQDDPSTELTWDLLALRAAAEAERGRPRAVTRVRAFYPSLHLNLAADYLRLRRREEARDHLRRARRACAVLSDDDHVDGVRAAIGRLELRLADGTGEAATGP